MLQGKNLLALVIVAFLGILINVILVGINVIIILITVIIVDILQSSGEDGSSFLSMSSLTLSMLTFFLLTMLSMSSLRRAVARMDGYQELTNRLQLHLNRQFQLQLQVGLLVGWAVGWLVVCASMDMKYVVSGGSQGQREVERGGG